VDRKFLLNSAYDQIKDQRWWLPENATEIDGREFYS